MLGLNTVPPRGCWYLGGIVMYIILKGVFGFFFNYQKLFCEPDLVAL